MTSNDQVLLEIRDLRVSFPLDEGTVQAVSGVDLTIKRGQVVGVVGESGCGKTVTAQTVLRIVPPPGRIESGQILLNQPRSSSNGSTVSERVDLAQLNPTGRQIRDIRGGDIAMIFQEPMSSFSPLHTIGNQLTESILLHKDVSKAQALATIIDLLEKVGIPNAVRRMDQYPHEFSGGMRQRAMIASALSCSPKLLIADEPTTALDVTIQAQILNLMKNLQQEMGMAIMFITHNLGVIAQIADEVAIMYLGRIVEHGSVIDVFDNPQHPYTVNLLRAIPRIGKTTGRRLFAIRGMVPSPFERPSGCPFHPRCEQVIAGRCDVDIPSVTQVKDGHTVACFLHQ
jgi:oligopeptide/dipeptide ABC transporter ATP-binding protein